MRALSYGPTGLVFAMVLIGCGEPTSGTVFTPTEPEAVVEPEIEEPVEEAMPETEEETVVESPDILGDLLDDD